MNMQPVGTTVRSCASFFMVICTILGMASCQQKSADETSEEQESEKVATLRKEVMAVHDEAMPLMTDIYKLRNTLKEQLQDSANVAAPRKAELGTLIARLDSADRGMRVWMRAFSEVKTTGVAEEDAIASLKIELEKITKVKADMERSVAAARAASEVSK